MDIYDSNDSDQPTTSRQFTDTQHRGLAMVLSSAGHPLTESSE